MPPLVTCICLTKDRPQFLKRAIDSYRSQTYQNKAFMLLDAALPDYRGRTIGGLRNYLVDRSEPGLIAHFDDDDWSSPTRLAEQVAFLEETGAEVVGYRDMPFHDERSDCVLFYDSRQPTGYAVGTSLLYRREVWERVPFPDQMEEDTAWQRSVGVENIKSQSSIAGGIKMFATIHKGNTSGKSGARYAPADPALEREMRALLDRLKVAQYLSGV